ncbi:MAG: ATP-binding protein [Pseudomonadota bacterium]
MAQAAVAPVPAQEAWRILVVEDDDVDRMAARRIVGRLPHPVTLVEATSAADAVAHLDSDRFDCLLLDYRLPDGTGLDVLEALRKHSPDRGAVIMLTGEGDEELAAKAIQTGADDYIPKNNLSTAALHRSIDNALEKCRLRIDLEARRTELGKRNQELEEFAYAISHDLQEPLRAVGSFLQLLQKKYGGELDDKADQYIDFAVSGAKRMRSMIVGILELSRIGREERELERVDLNQVVDAAMANLQASVRQAQASVDVGALPSLAGNRPRLIQLFQNLIGNAIKYRGDAQPQISIRAEPLSIDTLEASSHEATLNHRIVWKFCVSDNGIGIDPQFHDRAFAIFQRLHDRTRYEGTGIGLPVCKRIVEEQGGKIWFESQPGEGTRFYFTLPGDLRDGA